MDKRTIARELAMQAVYQLDIQGKDALDMSGKFFAENNSDGLVLKLATSWTRGVWQNLQQCDDLISQAAVKWELSRLSQVDKSILRISTYQLAFCPDIPAKVVINEAIEMAKKFSTESSSGFVNGVLDAIRKTLEKQKSKSMDENKDA